MFAASRKIPSACPCAPQKTDSDRFERLICSNSFQPVAATRQSFGMQCRWLEPLPSVNSDPVFLVKAGVWADAVVMSHQNLRVCRMCASLIGIMKSRYSRRALPIQRSQMAFALGALYGVFKTVSPNVVNAYPTRWNRCDHGSWMTNRYP